MPLQKLKKLQLYPICINAFYLNSETQGMQDESYLVERVKNTHFNRWRVAAHRCLQGFNLKCKNANILPLFTFPAINIEPGSPPPFFTSNE